MKGGKREVELQPVPEGHLEAGKRPEPGIQVEAPRTSPVPIRTPSKPDPSRVWTPGLVRHIASFLPPNEVACTLRLVDKATAAQFSGPPHATVHLSAPSPHHAFTHRWCRPGSLRSLSRWQKRELLRLTTRSGSIANLAAAMPVVAADDAFSCGSELLAAAAAAGDLDMCRHLYQRGIKGTPAVFVAAAEARRRAVCEWLLEEGRCVLGDDSCPAAVVRGGMLDLAERIATRPHTNQQARGSSAASVIDGAAEACDAETFRRLLTAYSPRCQHYCSPLNQLRVLALAAASTTPCYAEKIECLDAGGRMGHQPALAVKVAQRVKSGAAERLAWLKENGYALSLQYPDVMVASLRCGNFEALDYMEGERGFRLGASTPHRVLKWALEGRQLPMLQMLEARGCDLRGAWSLLDAVSMKAFSLATFAWLAEGLEEEVRRHGTELVEKAAGREDGAGWLAWLMERGCGWSAACFTAAAGAGASEEQLEWMVERGCPMPADGEPYVRAAVAGDLAAMRCLRRLDCPWGPGDCTFHRTIGATPSETPRVSGLECLVELGCPVEWKKAEAAAREHRKGCPVEHQQGQQQVLDWVVAQRRLAVREVTGTAGTHGERRRLLAKAAALVAGWIRNRRESCPRR